MENLTIFISHKLQSTERAIQIAGGLAAFGGERILVHHSGKYPTGTDWREKIEHDLTEASWLILLYEGPQIEWDWCLFETGFFRATMKDGKERRLFCLHHPDYTPQAQCKALSRSPQRKRN